MPSFDRWQSTWEELGGGLPDSQWLFADLIGRYQEPHRHYHTAQHLDECFDRLDEMRDLALRPAEVELALWFHDGIYEPLRPDNEQLSADWARATSLEAGIAPAIASRIYALVLLTRHTIEPIGADAEVLIDVDLSILAARPERFDEYEQQVRTEFSEVPESIFRQRRAEMLQNFLSRSQIFRTQHFVERYERQARSNLDRSLARLRPERL